ncbi:MAG TPA: TolC family protein [Gemmatimonadaceae bacterium]|nr:TolC family protein [Gemmatimonadaceae bacterium]
MSVPHSRTPLALGLCAAALTTLAGSTPAVAQSPDLTRSSAERVMTLGEAIALAQERGIGAQTARSALEAARWRERAFAARLMPRLALNSDAANIDRGLNSVIQPNGEARFVRQSQNISWVGVDIVQPLPWTGGELTVGSRLTRLDQQVDQLTSQTWQSQPFVVGFRQGLFRPRTLAWDRREQDLALTVAERQYHEAREDLAISTAAAFFDLYAAQVALGNAVGNAAVNDTLYTLNAGRYDVGRIGENDLLQSELALLRSRAALDGARLERDRTAAALRRLLRLAPTEPIMVVAPGDVPLVQADTALAVAQALLNASAGVESALQVLRTERQVREARSASGFRADVEASLGFNQTSTALSSAYESPLAKQRFRMYVEMPLLQWGGGRAAVQAAQADQDRAEGVARSRRETVEEDARFAALQLSQSQRMLLLAAKADTVAQKRFEVAYNRYVIGRIGIGELYIAQNEKDAAVLSYVQALRGYWAAHYRLRRLTLYDFVEGRPLVAGG